MTHAQILEAKRLAGTMPREWIALALGVSLSNLKRSCKGTSFNYHNKYKANPDIVKRVTKYYEKHGKTKTQEKFPDLNVRSIVERYRHEPRQIRWTGPQLIEIIKMHGFISKKNQAKFFKRPRANEGSIVSVWQKTLKIKRSHTDVGHHMVASWKIERFLKKGCPKTPACHNGIEGAYLWHDVDKFLKKSTPKIIKDCAKAIALYQEWLFDSKEPRKEVLKMIKERR